MNKNDLLDNLTRWQASNHPALADKKPEELFEASFVKRYKQLHRIIWERLVRTHITLVVLEQLQDFPFDVLYPEGNNFWRLVLLNFSDVVIVLLNGLLNDHKYSYTIKNFKNEISRATWLSSDKKALFKKELKKRSFDSGVKSLEGKIKTIRDNFVAHQALQNEEVTPSNSDEKLDLQDLRKVCNATSALFGALSFGSSYVTLTIDFIPAEIAGEVLPNSLEKVIRAILLDSDFVNYPERFPQEWPLIRKEMDSKLLDTMNDLRKRIGLPPA